MATYAEQKLSISKKKQELLNELTILETKEADIAKKRTVEIGELVAKRVKEIDLLDLPDEVLKGLLVVAKQALEAKSDKLQEWAQLGARFSKSHKKSQVESTSA